MNPIIRPIPRRPRNRSKPGRPSNRRPLSSKLGKNLKNAVPLPPLFQKKQEESSESAFREIQQGTTARIVTPEKKGDRAPPGFQPMPPRKQSTFVPVDRAAPTSKTFAAVISPTAVPYCIEIGSPTNSTAPTEDTTEGSLSPFVHSPASNSVLKTTGSTPSPKLKSYRYSPASPRKSPTKNPRRRGSSPHRFLSCSPGGSSVGSLSTSEDAARKQRIKTELCRNYMQSNYCSWGDDCVYAHGEDDLRYTKLMEMQLAGLIDNAEIYRSKPCLTWVATGSCPFENRCESLHDPRVAGSQKYWLIHTETQGNSISTDINVDGLYQKHLGAIQYSNPFGESFSLDLDEFDDLYKLVCNTNKRRRNHLSESHKLSIALKMRGSHQWMYKFRPTHIIYGEHCMVLQKLAFNLDKSGVAIQIPFQNYRPANSQHVLVREIAFGPDSDPSIRGVTLWFNIPEDRVTECNAQDAKRYRWKKRMPPADYRVPGTRSLFDVRECFTMVRPLEQEAYDFTTDILRHRFRTVQAEQLSDMQARFLAINAMKEEKEVLQERFDHCKRSWIAWSFPINEGRQQIDDTTPTPSTNTRYEPYIEQVASESPLKSKQGVPKTVQGENVTDIWQSFVTNGFEQENRSDWTEDTRRRLPIFEHLSFGNEVSLDRSLPHISKPKNQKAAPRGNTHIARQSERCWKSLLLKDKKKHAGSNEWTIVWDHFQSRNKKATKTRQP